MQSARPFLHRARWAARRVSTARTQLMRLFTMLPLIGGCYRYAPVELTEVQPGEPLTARRLSAVLARSPHRP